VTRVGKVFDFTRSPALLCESGEFISLAYTRFTTQAAKKGAFKANTSRFFCLEKAANALVRGTRKGTPAPVRRLIRC
jgi:hypothetical protein